MPDLLKTGSIYFFVKNSRLTLEIWHWENLLQQVHIILTSSSWPSLNLIWINCKNIYSDWGSNIFPVKVKIYWNKNHMKSSLMLSGQLHVKYTNFLLSLMMNHIFSKNPGKQLCKNCECIQWWGLYVQFHWDVVWKHLNY